MPPDDARSNPTLPDLLVELSGNISGLVRSEIQLARAEASEKLARSILAIAALVGAAILALGAVNVLLEALVAAITGAGVAPPLAGAGVGAAVALAAGLLAYRGISDLRSTNLAPRRTLNSLRRDAAVAEEQMP